MLHLQNLEGVEGIKFVHSATVSIGSNRAIVEVSEKLLLDKDGLRLPGSHVVVDTFSIDSEGIYRGPPWQGRLVVRRGFWRC